MKKNEAQEQLIKNVYGQTIVIACPGSGKTTTLLRRINNMVCNENIDPKEILMITFTKAAATEMNERYKKQYGANPGITFCTIHALCFAILKQFEGYEYEDILSDPGEVMFDCVKNIKAINDKVSFVKDILMDISVVKNSGVDVRNFEPKCCEDRNLFLSLFKKYQLFLKKQNKVDFDDILLKTYSLLKNNPYVLEKVKDRYGYLHVDEYQDTNLIQKKIIYLIAGENGNLTVVGDDDQSIYGFRGAKPEIMLNFKKDYPFAKEIYMSTNYRSDSLILDYASNLINKNKDRFKKDIIAGRNEIGNVEFKQFSGKGPQLEYISNAIKKLINNGENPNDIAVLYRNNSQAIPVTDIFINNNIPFKSNETIESKYNHWLFKDIMAYHKMSKNEGSQSDYVRTVTHPNRYLDKYRIEKNEQLTLDKMYGVLKNPYIEEWKNNKTKSNIRKYLLLLKTISGMNPEKTINTLLKGGDYDEYIKEYCEFRSQNESELLSIIDSYQYDIKNKGIDTFSKWMNYANAYNMFISNKQNSKEGVCLSTMHKSKGLEWKYVFIIDCVEKITPSDKCDSI